MTRNALSDNKGFPASGLILCLTIGHSPFLLASYIARRPFANDLSFDSMGHLPRNQVVAVLRAFGEGQKYAPGSGLVVVGG